MHFTDTALFEAARRAAENRANAFEPAAEPKPAPIPTTPVLTVNQTWIDHFSTTSA